MTAYLSGSWCGTRREHERKGIVTNQPGELDLKRAHCSVAVCGSIRCISKAHIHVEQFTHESAVYIRDAS